jgi:hypothetical protein
MIALRSRTSRISPEEPSIPTLRSRKNGPNENEKHAKMCCEKN